MRSHSPAGRRILPPPLGRQERQKRSTYAADAATTYRLRGKRITYCAQARRLHTRLRRNTIPSARRTDYIHPSGVIRNDGDGLHPPLRGDWERRGRDHILRASAQITYAPAAQLHTVRKADGLHPPLRGDLRRGADHIHSAGEIGTRCGRRRKKPIVHTLLLDFWRGNHYNRKVK